MSIRQIFAHIFASENKVSETTFSEFSEISRHSRNFPETENRRKYLEFEFVLTCLWCVTKLVNFTSLTIHFSSQSDKYSLIFSPLKIKFFWRQFQDFQEFLENSQKSENSKMCWNCWILDSYWNTDIWFPKYMISAQFDNYLLILSMSENKCKSKKQVQIQKNNCRNKKCTLI